MAELALSGLCSDMSGRLGNTIVYRHNGHLVQKIYTKPANPQTTYQAAVRANWSNLLSTWGSLSDESRFSWHFAASQIFFTNRIGSKFHPSAQQLFMCCNQNLFSIGLSTITDFVSPIPIASLIAPTAFMVSHPIFPHPHQAAVINFVGQTTALNLIYLIFASPGISAGISNGHKYLRLIGSIPAGTSGSFDFLSLYDARYPGIGFSGKVFLRLKPIEINSGIAGQPLDFSCIVSSL
jgi:hypothetical protein